MLDDYNGALSVTIELVICYLTNCVAMSNMDEMAVDGVDNEVKST